MSINLDPDYRPSADEEFMNEKQQEYFRRKLTSWHDELLGNYEETRQQLEATDRPGSDYADVASSEADRALELRTRGRDRKLIAKIDEALERIKNGTYGYCADTGVPIGLARLEARPVAALSIEAQERHERLEQQ